MNNKLIISQFFKRLCVISACFLLYSVSFAETGVTLNLKDADIRSFIETVAEATERNFVVDPRVKAKVTVISARPMNREEVYQVFLSVLQVHGYAAVQVGQIIKILPDVNAKQGPVATAGERSQGTGDELVTRVVPIKHVPAAQMVPILRPLVPQQGHLAAYPNSNVLIISDRAANIQRLISIIDRIDRPDNQEIEIVPLQHASATEVVRIVNNLNRQGAQGGQVPGSTTLAADQRSNSILLSGDSAARLRIRGLIAHLDTPLEGGGNSQVIFLKYAKASELAPILKGISQFEAREGQQGGTAATSSTGSNEVNIQADDTNNALIITASPAKYESLRRIIYQLDVRRAQVLVEAIIAEVSTGLSKELGVQFAYLPTERSSGTTPAVGALFPNTGANLPALFADSVSDTLGAVSSGFFAGAVKLSGKDRFAALLRALEGDVATNILSTPTLVTLDNEEAEIIVAQNVPFITGQYTNIAGTDTTVNPFQTIERQDVGLTLRITPQINEGDSVKLDVEQEVSSLSPSPVATDLITNKRSIKTTVMVRDQQTIVLGGLIEDTFRDNVQKVPILGDIPLLGHLFKSTTTTKDKQNLMVFIRPVIIRDDATTDIVTNAKYTYLRARQIDASLDDRGLIKKGAVILPDLDELVTQIPGGSSISSSPVSVDQLLQQTPAVESTPIEATQDIQLEELQPENVSIPVDSDVIIVE